MTRRRVAALVAAATVLAGAALVWGAPNSSAEIRVEHAVVEVPAGPGETGVVRIDTSLFLPERTPAPAVLLAHGFGGNKDDLVEQARELAGAGQVVLTYSARGFGESTGQVGLNDPDREVADASRLLDRLAERSDVVQDGPGDPRVAVTGASYGGALSMLLAGTDKRVDALVPVATYHDLAQALVPNAGSTTEVTEDTPAAGTFAPDGVFKTGWAGILFAAAMDDDAGPCGRFTPEVCRAYTNLATTGRMSAETSAFLARISPAAVTGRIDVPTLLVQGEQDTLFGLDQSDEAARRIAAGGGDVQVVWFAGGHDGSMPEAPLRARIADWLGHRLAGDGENPFGAFEYDVLGDTRTQDGPVVRGVRATSYPGLAEDATEFRRLDLNGGAREIVNPPGGNPPALSGVPGMNGVAEGAGWLSTLFTLDMPGQTATFTTEALPTQLEVVGSTRVRLRVSAVGAPGDGVLFARLYDVSGNGTRTMPGNTVAPVRLPPLPEDGSPVEVTVTLPGVVRAVQAGHRLELAVGTTDQWHHSGSAAATYRVAVAGALDVPVVPATPVGVTWPVGQLLGIGGTLGAVVLLGVFTGLRRRRPEEDPALADTPLVIEGLAKAYPGKPAAVADLSFRVEQGRVVALLGPNGAGKTTTLRMLMGLTTPSAGSIRVFGRLVTPGAPVLARVGAFVEGAGFLPHLSGVDNLRMYWAATGLPDDRSHLDEVLEIASLGDAVHHRVRTYSQGMRQRLAIAQAMLGLPDLLVLDEPTNGLDPTQIHQMREVLRDYAASGRTVLVSSHLLAEVEQTCDHVVVMHHGRLVAAGPVAELLAAGGEASFTVDRPAEAATVLSDLSRTSTVDIEGTVVHADLGDVARGTAVTALVAAGVSVSGAGPRRRLEDAFLRLIEEET